MINPFPLFIRELNSSSRIISKYSKTIGPCQNRKTTAWHYLNRTMSLVVFQLHRSGISCITQQAYLINRPITFQSTPSFHTIIDYKPTPFYLFWPLWGPCYAWLNANNLRINFLTFLWPKPNISIKDMVLHFLWIKNSSMMQIAYY